MTQRISGPCQGVRCRLHSTRQHNRRPDKYYILRLRDSAGRQREEGLGWASEGWTDLKACALAHELRENIRTGRGPQSLKEKREELEEQRFKERQPATFSQGATAYLAWARTNKASWRADETRLRLHILPALGPRPMSDITETDIERLKSSLALAPATVRQCLTLVHRVYSFCRTHTPDGEKRPLHTGGAPTEAVRRPPVHNERERFLTPDEAERLIALARGRNPTMADLIALALHTGMRRGEMTRLRWDHVSLETATITIPGQDGRRGKGKGRVPLNQVAREVLASRLEKRTDHPLVFPPGELPAWKNPGGAMKAEAMDISKPFRVLADAAGLNEGVTDRRQRVTFHTLRHTYASWLAMAGTPIPALMALMRHKSIEMTMRYSHLLPDATRQAVETLCARLPGQPAGPKTSS